MSRPRVVSLTIFSSVILLIGPRNASAQQPTHLDTVSVVASRTGTTDPARSVQVITRADIARMAARNVNDILATALGVDVDSRSPAQADVSIRGSTPDQVVVLVDGVRMTDVQSSHYTMDLAVPLASIERIEILRGAGSALYGPDAIGGVINIVTTDAPSSAARVGTGSFGAVDAALSDGTTRNGIAFGGSADFDKSDGQRDGTDYRMGQGRVSLGAPIGGGTVRSDAAFALRNFGAAEFYAPYNSIEQTRTAALDSRYDAAVGAWTLDVSGSTRRHQDDYVLIRGQPQVYENHHDSWQTDGELVGRRALGPAALALGVDAEHDQLASNALGGRREWRDGLFAEAGVGEPTGTSIHVGARGDRSSLYGSFFSPSLSASALAAPWLRVHASAGTGYRAPTWTERYYTDPSNVGDPDLAAERFWSSDAGARATAGLWSLDVTGFARHATNLIDWVRPAGSPDDAVWHAMNVGDATYRGVEASLAMPTIDGVSTSLYGNGLTLDDRQGEGLEGKYALRPITQQIGITVTTPAIRHWTLRVDAARERRASEDGYLTANARLAWQRGAFDATIDVRNLANADWLDASGMPAAGRGVYIGVGVR